MFENLFRGTGAEHIDESRFSPVLETMRFIWKRHLVGSQHRMVHALAKGRVFHQSFGRIECALNLSATPRLES